MRAIFAHSHRQAQWLSVVADIPKNSKIERFRLFEPPRPSLFHEPRNIASTCPDCGGPLRYLPRRLEILRADDTS
jgi:hypothetical protein